jgi:hypothetical protein
MLFTLALWARVPQRLHVQVSENDVAKHTVVKVGRYSEIYAVV